MSALDDLLAIPEASKVPLFPVQAPDGLRTVSETDRQVALFRAMRIAAPTVFGFPIPNAGKRNPAQARKEGILGGVFDTEWNWSPRQTAWIEMKGYDKAGRAGKLSPAQVDWGNRMHLLGHRVACFFDPIAAVEWLQSLGAPVRLSA